MSSKIFIIGIGVFSLVFAIGAYFWLSGGQESAKTITYSLKDRERPKAEVKETFTDFGKVKVANIKEKEFMVKNVGEKPLQLFDISSSCGCTSGQIVYQGKSSKEFSMHSQSDYKVEIMPQTEAKVRVTYRPFVMPVFGLVEREVYVSTNDPANQKLVFKVKAYVE